MRFSDLFSIAPRADTTWFDPVLSVDTKLFVDPFLLYADEQGEFIGSHGQVVAFFNAAFKNIARSRGDRASPHWRRAQNMLRLPEVEELCLGYAGSSTQGSGSGKAFAAVMAGALWDAVRAGLEEITHFEEVGILREGIGADRISDATAGLLRDKLARYTESVCVEYGVPTEAARYPRGKYIADDDAWGPLHAELPRNPYNGKPVLLIPKRYLRELPTVSADDFWDFCYTNDNETLRREFNDDVSRRVSKRDIVYIARKHPELRRSYLADVERRRPTPYDHAGDPDGLLQWYERSKEFVASNPIAFAIDKEADFLLAVEKMVEAYRTFVEENRGWALLWNDSGTPRKEASAQDLFLGIVKHYCFANDIDISREPNIGRGPVDFKASRGSRLKALLELKLAKNTKFWNGLSRQLPTYQVAENVAVGFFIVILFTDADDKRVAGITAAVSDVRAATGLDIRHVLVDASKDPPSASKL